MAKVALTRKQEKFLSSYLRLGNAADAYRDAYDARKMNDESIRKEAQRLLEHPRIAPRVVLANEKAFEAAISDRSRTLQTFAKAAYGKPTDKLTWAHKLKAADCLAKVDGLYEEDNKQKTTTVAIQVVLE